MFKLNQVMPGEQSEAIVKERMHAKDALVALIIPADFTVDINRKARSTANKALKDFGLEADTALSSKKMDSVLFFYHPVLQQSFRQSVQGALNSALQLVQSKQILRTLYA